MSEVPRADVTVCVPTLPARGDLLLRALESVRVQTLRPKEVIVTLDAYGYGAARIRNRALEQVETPFVAFLDDDDEFEPDHIATLVAAQEETDADLVYPWFTPIGRKDPLGAEGRTFDPERLRKANFIPVTVLVRTAVIRSVGGFQPLSGTGPPCEDWGCWLRMLDAGAKFVHVPKRTWKWYFHGKNTGGDPRRVR